MTARTTRRGRYAPAAIAVTAAIAITVAALAFALPGRSPGRALPALHPAAAPTRWHHATLPNGTAVLSYPPSLRPSPGTPTPSPRPSAARAARSGSTSTPPPAGQRATAGRAAFRLRLLRSDDAASARQDAAAQGVRFRGGTGSCVIDDYVTRIGRHHYQEMACLVQGHPSAGPRALEKARQALAVKHVVFRRCNPGAAVMAADGHG